MAQTEPDLRHQIVAAVLVADRRVLLCHRSATKEWHPGVWDLPGGHVEAGEASSHALARELREELEIQIAVPAEDCLARVQSDQFVMQVWRITEWLGTPCNSAPDEHDEIAWFTLSEAKLRELAHASYPALFEKALSLE